MTGRSIRALPERTLFSVIEAGGKGPSGVARLDINGMDLAMRHPQLAHLESRAAFVAREGLYGRKALENVARELYRQPRIGQDPASSGLGLPLVLPRETVARLLTGFIVSGNGGALPQLPQRPQFGLLLLGRTSGLLQDGDAAVAHRTFSGDWIVGPGPLVGVVEIPNPWEERARKEDNVVVIDRSLARELPLSVPYKASRTNRERLYVPLASWISEVRPKAVYAAELDPRPFVRGLARSERERRASETALAPARKRLEWAVAAALAAGVSRGDLARELQVSGERISQMKTRVECEPGAGALVLRNASRVRDTAAFDRGNFLRRVQRARDGLRRAEAEVEAHASARDEMLELALEHASQARVAAWLDISQQRVAQLNSRAASRERQLELFHSEGIWFRSWRS